MKRARPASPVPKHVRPYKTLGRDDELPKDTITLEEYWRLRDEERQANA